MRIGRLYEQRGEARTSVSLVFNHSEDVYSWQCVIPVVAIPVFDFPAGLHLLHLLSGRTQSDRRLGHSSPLYLQLLFNLLLLVYLYQDECQVKDNKIVSVGRKIVVLKLRRRSMK